MRLDYTCNLPMGTRDALHVPYVVARWDTPNDIKERLAGLKPGSYVKFINTEYTKFVVCEKADAQGVVNPFIDEISCYDNVVVLLIPGITTPVRHNFDIKPELLQAEKEILELELRGAKNQDPGCAECYEIRNNEVVRN